MTHVTGLPAGMTFEQLNDMFDKSLILDGDYAKAFCQQYGKHLPNVIAICMANVQKKGAPHDVQ